MLIRVLAITAIVVTHATSLHIGGGATALIMLIGYNLWRFQRYSLIEGKTFALVKRLFGAVLFPFYLILLFFSLGLRAVDLRYWALFANFSREPARALEPLWFISAYAQFIGVTALAIGLIVPLRKAIAKVPFEFGVLEPVLEYRRLGASQGHALVGAASHPERISSRDPAGLDRGSRKNSRSKKCLRRLRDSSWRPGMAEFGPRWIPCGRCSASGRLAGGAGLAASGENADRRSGTGRLDIAKNRRGILHHLSGAHYTDLGDAPFARQGMGPAGGAGRDPVRDRGSRAALADEAVLRAPYNGVAAGTEGRPTTLCRSRSLRRSIST